MLHKHVRVQSSGDTGQGLFATAPIAAGEVIWREDVPLKIVSIDEVHTWSEEKQQWFFQYAFQVDDTLWKLLHDGENLDPSYFMNHSCNPTVWFVDDTTMVARRDLKAGEEITYDYETSQLDMDLTCTCGEQECRKRINGTAHKTAAFQRTYRGHVLQYIAKKF